MPEQTTAQPWFQVLLANPTSDEPGASSGFVKKICCLSTGAQTDVGNSVRVTYPKYIFPYKLCCFFFFLNLPLCIHPARKRQAQGNFPLEKKKTENQLGCDL